jgi:hypothetical protein
MLAATTEQRFRASSSYVAVSKPSKVCSMPLSLRGSLSSASVALTAAIIAAIVDAGPHDAVQGEDGFFDALMAKYGAAIDRDSAREMLARKLEAGAQEAEGLGIGPGRRCAHLDGEVDHIHAVGQLAGAGRLCQVAPSRSAICAGEFRRQGKRQGRGFRFGAATAALAGV